MFKLLRSLSGFFYVFPFAVLYYMLLPFSGRKKAISFSGKFLLKATEFVMSILVPKVKRREAFCKFKNKLKKHFILLSSFYDLKIKNETNDMIEFNVCFCPVSNALHKLGLFELAKYSCAGDMKLQKSYDDYWKFQRDSIHLALTGNSAIIRI